MDDASASRAVRVLVVDDHTLVRKGLCALLATEPAIKVVADVGDGRESLVAAAQLKPDVVLMDLEMPGMDGVEATRRLLDADPGVRIVVLTSFGGDARALEAIRAGAVGFLLKDARPDEVVRAVQLAAEDGSMLDPRIARRLLLAVAGQATEELPTEPLTERETDVVCLIAQGLSNRAIGARLDITVATVRTHVGHLLTKLGVTSRTQAALWALRSGLARLDDGEGGGS